MKRLILLLIVVLAFLPSAGWAANTWYVDTTLGTDGASCGTASGASACKTMHYIDATRSTVASGDTVHVAAGTYAETYSAAYSVGFTKGLNWIFDGAATVGKSDRTTGPAYVLQGYTGSVSISGPVTFNGYSVAGGVGLSLSSAASNISIGSLASTGYFLGNVMHIGTTAAANTNLTITNESFDDSPTNFYYIGATPGLTIQNSFFDGPFTKRSIVYDQKTTGTTNFNSNHLTINSTQNNYPYVDFIGAGGSANVNNNTWLVTQSAYPGVLGSAAGSGSASSVATVTGNTFTVGTGNGWLVYWQGNWQVAANNNNFTLSTAWTDHGEGGALITLQSVLRASTIQGNTFNTSITSFLIHASANNYLGSGTPNGAHVISNNTSTIASLSGMAYEVGLDFSQGVGDNTLQGVTISQNTVNATVGGGTGLEAIFYGFNNGGIITRNKVIGAGNPFVIKGGVTIQVPYTVGSTAAPALNAVLTSGGQTAYLRSITISSGTFAGNNAVGTMYVDTQTGAWSNNASITWTGGSATAGTQSAYYTGDWGATGTPGTFAYNSINGPSLEGCWVKGVKNIKSYNQTWVESGGTYAASGMLYGSNNSSVYMNSAAGLASKNSIFYLVNANSIGLNVADAGSNSGIVSDYNNIYLANAVGSYGKVISTAYPNWNTGGAGTAWVRDAGYDTHSANTNPLFYSIAANDLRLMLGSPARGRADPTVWSGTANVYDVNGVRITDASGNFVVIPDMGAYQSQPASVVGMGMGM